MGFKSFKVVTFEQILGFDDGDSDGISLIIHTTNQNQDNDQIVLIWIQIVGDGDGEFEGLKGGSRMMSLLTLFGGLKNVFKVS